MSDIALGGMIGCVDIDQNGSGWDDGPLRALLDVEIKKSLARRKGDDWPPEVTT